jgi:hypothetical protein
MSALVFNGPFTFLFFMSTDLARSRDPQSCKQSIRSMSTMRRKNTLNKWDNTGAMENVQLCRVFFEDLRKGELLDSPSTVIRRVESNVSGRCVFFGRFFNGEIALSRRRRASLRWPQT